MWKVEVEAKVKADMKRTDLLTLNLDLSLHCRESVLSSLYASRPGVL
jgi:hypothetical protein